MNHYFVSACAAGVMTVAALGLAGVAGAAPDVADTVTELRADGYHVILNRTGAKPLSACSAASVHPGQTFFTVDSRGSSLTETVLSKTVHVDAGC